MRSNANRDTCTPRPHEQDAGKCCPERCRCLLRANDADRKVQRAAKGVRRSGHCADVASLRATHLRTDYQLLGWMVHLGKFHAKKITAEPCYIVNEITALISSYNSITAGMARGGEDHDLKPCGERLRDTNSELEARQLSSWRRPCWARASEPDQFSGSLEGTRP